MTELSLYLIIHIVQMYNSKHVLAANTVSQLVIMIGSIFHNKGRYFSTVVWGSPTNHLGIP